MHLVTIRVISVFVAIVACGISYTFSILAADEKPSAPESPSQTSPSATAQTGEKTEAQTSPKGTFRIETVLREAEDPTADRYEQQYVVSTADPKVREPLGQRRSAQPAAYFISPDERWIFATIHLGSRMADGELFKRGEGLKFEQANKSQPFAAQVWRFFARQERLKPDAVHSERGDAGIIEFRGWSPDSGRLLVDLRAGDFRAKRERRVDEWYVYFDTKTGKFELTNYLRGLNKGAWDRYANLSGYSGLPPEVIAEPLGELPPEAESKKRYEAAERRVKEYEEQLKSSRGAQGGLVDTREIGAKFYAESGPKSTAGRRYWQYMADSTEARASDIERQLGSNVK
jgi:hypothetical protein